MSNGKQFPPREWEIQDSQIEIAGIPDKYTDKSPLRYPGGKSRAIQMINQYVPKNITHVVSPFVGGASLELWWASRGITVAAGDLYYPLINFWREAQHSPKKMAEWCYKYYPMDEFDHDDFDEVKAIYGQRHDDDTVSTAFEDACYFYILNRTSYAGMGAIAGMMTDTPSYTVRLLRLLYNLKCPKINFHYADFSGLLEQDRECFAYCDPPYWMEDQFYCIEANKDFDHERLLRSLERREGPWIVSYNDCPEVRDLYKHYQIVKVDWAYSMGDKRECKEVLILNT